MGFGRANAVWVIAGVVGAGSAAGMATAVAAREAEVFFADDFGPGSRGQRVRNTIGDPAPAGLGYATDTPHGYALKHWIVADASAGTAVCGFWCIPQRADGTVEAYAQQSGRSRNSIAYIGRALPQTAQRYTIEFRQWCSDNDYIGFIVGATRPTIDHDGAEFGYL